MIISSEHILSWHRVWIDCGGRSSHPTRLGRDVIRSRSRPTRRDEHCLKKGRVMQQHTHSNPSSHHFLMRVKIRPPTHSHVTPPSAHPKQKGKSETKDISNPPPNFLTVSDRRTSRATSGSTGLCWGGERALHCICTCMHCITHHYCMHGAIRHMHWWWGGRGREG